MGAQHRGELTRFDVKSGQYVPYLSGMSAEHLDFSRDGRWMAYVAYPEATMWRRQARWQPAVAAHLPSAASCTCRAGLRTEEQIAFMASGTGQALEDPSNVSRKEVRPNNSCQGAQNEIATTAGHRTGRR